MKKESEEFLNSVKKFQLACSSFTAGIVDEVFDVNSKATVQEIASLQLLLKDQIGYIKDGLTSIQSRYDKIRKHILPEKMDDEGINSINITGVGNVSLANDMYVSIVTGKKENVYRWLIDNGMQDIINRYVPPGTLKKVVKDLYKDGVPPPEDIVNQEPYVYTKITAENKRI